MSEKALLEYLRGYSLDHPSLDAAFRADPAVTLEKLCDASYHHVHQPPRPVAGRVFRKVS